MFLRAYAEKGECDLFKHSLAAQPHRHSFVIRAFVTITNLVPAPLFNHCLFDRFRVLICAGEPSYKKELL
jgi:hypothetical protein